MEPIFDENISTYAQYVEEHLEPSIEMARDIFELILNGDFITKNREEFE